MTTPPGNDGNDEGRWRGEQPEEPSGGTPGWQGSQDGPGTSGTPGTPGSQGPQGPPSYPSYPSYPSTPHPEDNPAYRGYGTPGQGGQPGAGYGYGYGTQAPQGYQGHQGYQGYGAPGGQPGPAAQGTGRVTVLDAVSWGFRSVFSNWLIWILGALALFVVVLAFTGLVQWVLGDATGMFAQLLIVVVSMLVSVFIYTGALREIDAPKVRLGDFFRDVNLWPGFAVLLLVQLFTWLVVAVIAIPLVGSVFFTGPGPLQTEAETMAFLGRVLAFSGIVMVLSVLLSPLTTFLAWYAVDGREGVMGAISSGLRDAWRNYGKLLVFFLVSYILIGLAGIATFGLALLILGPTMLLTQAHLYRQMSGGRLPDPQLR